MLEALREIINPDVLINHDGQNRQLSLDENGKDSKIEKLYITNMPDNFIAFTLDYQPGGPDNRKFQQLSPYVNIGNGKGVNKGCDLIILWYDSPRYLALVFDLKSDKPKTEVTQMQLDNSELYFKYLLSMVTYHYGIATDNVIIKKAIVATSNRNIPKGPTYPKNSEQSQFKNFKIEHVKPCSNKNGYIQFKQLTRWN